MENLQKRALAAAENLCKGMYDEDIIDNGMYYEDIKDNVFDLVTADEDTLYFTTVRAAEGYMPMMPLTRLECEDMAAEWLADQADILPANISVAFRFIGIHVLDGTGKALTKIATGDAAWEV